MIINAMQHIEVGDIFRASWGYDQTNVDYYKVVRKTAKMVELVEIGSKMGEATSWASAHVSPDPDRVIGTPFKRIPTAYAQGCGKLPAVYVSIKSFAVARKVQPDDVAHASWWH